ncbi:MAG: sugar ABC transporter permease [Eubacteriales bacterium]|nr:sugar ABC transporter permease [Eubacteriales bacterium]
MKKNLSSFLFTLPSLFFFCIALLIPFFMGINIAFTDWNGVTKDYNYVGLENFIRMFSDSRIVAPIKNTLILAVIGVIANNAVTLGLALLFTKFNGKFGSICRLIVFVPCCLSGVLSAYIWKFIFRFVLSALTGLNSPLGSMFWVLPAIVVIALWNGAGINMLIYYAALKNVPTELVEAAIVDGAGRLAVFKNITLPMIAPAFTTCVTMTFTAMLKEFGTVMSATGGGPARASETISMYIYNNLYTYSRAGYGQAISLAFLAFLILVGNLMTNFFRKREVEL